MIALETLRSEREEIKKRLTQIDAETKELEAKLRDARQREIQAKREVEALSALIDLQEARQVQDGK